jgi:hypothetical protein
MLYHLRKRRQPSNIGPDFGLSALRFPPSGACTAKQCVHRPRPEIHTHVLNSGPGVRSPLEALDGLFRDHLP